MMNDKQFLQMIERLGKNSRKVNSLAVRISDAPLHLKKLLLEWFWYKQQESCGLLVRSSTITSLNQRFMNLKGRIIKP